MVHVGVVSLSSNHPEAPAPLRRLLDAFPQTNISVHNGAIASTTSEYMSLCNNLHIPKNSSIVILEYAVNDEHNPYPLWNNSVGLDGRLSLAVYLNKVYSVCVMPDSRHQRGEPESSVYS